MTKVASRLELWGGIECTLNRTGDVYRDQLALSGHYGRPDDLDRIAELGIAALRYPLLWERIAPTSAATCDWEWPDHQLARLRQHGVRVIAGLVHHGSGPAHTSLVSDDFAPGLGTFAGKVAERYPWIEDWTPVNEPVTTARFSALYSHWYPHHRDERSFWLALLNQIDGTRFAMQAIRAINPAARLIQTDDLGRTYATPRLAEQATFDNLRRWAGWDLLFGRVTPHHPLWHRIDGFGLGDRLRRIADAPCPPDIVGVNHYLTSDRFLDQRIERYPPHLHGGNGRMRYADTEAIRVLEPPPSGLCGALREAWQRYGTPLAVTEVHNGCTREEQLRWAAEAWDGATALRDEGVDVRAVTAWALLGSRDWDTLLTRPGRYETGVWDVQSVPPRQTALAKLYAGLATNAPRHPVATELGWWRRVDRLTHLPLSRPSTVGRAKDNAPSATLLICGATGTLGQAVARACRERGINFVLTGRGQLDLDRRASIADALDAIRPWAVVNAAGWVRVDEAEDDEAACHRANASGAIALAEACAGRDIPCVAISTDLVFDGALGRPYLEGDAPAPLSAYGRSKAAMEAGLRDLPGMLIARTAAFFSAHDAYNFAVAVTTALEHGQPFAAAEDVKVTPTFVPDLTGRLLDLLIDEDWGIWHLTNGEALSWAAFARRIASACGLDERLVQAVPSEMLGWVAPRPRQAALFNSRGAALEPLDTAIERFAADRHHFGRDRQANRRPAL